jgi:hypothetical protein
MTVDTRDTASRLGRICLNLLLEGAACALGSLDNRFMRSLIGRRSDQTLGKRLPMRLPDARFCTAWASKSSADGSIATPAWPDCADNQFSSPEVTPHEFFNAEFVAMRRAVHCHDSPWSKRRYRSEHKTYRLPNLADGTGMSRLPGGAASGQIGSGKVVA